MELKSTNQIKNYHSTWVKVAHWIGTFSFFFLLFSGFEILMVHPRLYWGEMGNDLTPALFELPISRNYQHGGWTTLEPLLNQLNSPMSAGRTYPIFNENGWGRSLHFLAAWFLVFNGLFYLILAIFTGHIKNNLLPRFNELTFELILKDIKDHLKAGLAYLKGPQYGLLQKISYLLVIFILLPIIVLTGLTMSPAIAASHPYLLTMFFGVQSARTIHFFASSSLFLFLIIHIWMIIKSGFKKQMLAMTIKK